jgi:hypothetical protein
MLEVVGALLLSGLLFGAFVLALVVVPLMLAFMVVGLVLKLVFFVLLMPLRILFWGLGIAFSAVGLVLKGVLLTGAAALLIVLGLLPLLPLVLIGVGLYFLLRSRRTEGLTPAGPAA